MKFRLGAMFQLYTEYELEEDSLKEALTSLHKYVCEDLDFNKIKIKQVKDVFKFPGTLIFQLLYSSPLLKYNDAVNDLDAFSALRYSVRGPKLANWAPWRVISLYKTT